MNDQITNNRIVEIRSLTWHSNRGCPVINLLLNNISIRDVEVDPYPCYSHDKSLVWQLVTVLEKSFPLPEPKYFILNYEVLERANGFAETSYLFENPVYYMVLSGKRTPIHPAVTRYVVAHEYCHLICNFIIEKGADFNSFYDNYAKIRGMENKYGKHAKEWHLDVKEIAADDARLTLFNIEPEFYPHDCEYPMRNIAVVDFWNNVQTKFGLDKSITS